MILQSNLNFLINKLGQGKEHIQIFVYFYGYFYYRNILVSYYHYAIKFNFSDIYFLEVKKSFYGFNGLLNLYFERSIDIALFRPLSKIELAGS